MQLEMQDYTLLLLRKELVLVRASKDLGVIVDPNLSYNKHIIRIVFSGMPCHGPINRVNYVFEKGRLLQLLMP